MPAICQIDKFRGFQSSPLPERFEHLQMALVGIFWRAFPAKERQMPAYRAMGDLLIPADELKLRHVQKSRAGETLKFSVGEISSEAFFTETMDLTLVGRAPFKPIGMGLPLSIMIRHVYTGRFPKQILGSPVDLLLTSSLKNITAFDASSRAVNFLKHGVGTHSHFDSPAATEQGTPLVCYVPSVTSPGTTLTLDLVFHRFPDDLLNKVASTFTAAAGIPIFLPAALYLLAAGSLVKLAANLGHGIFDGTPDFSPTVELDFDIPGSDTAQAGFWFLVERGFDTAPYKFVPGTGLVKKDSGEVYSGDVPHVVISLDGSEQDAFASFAPTMASSAILSRFLDAQDGSSVALDTLVNAMKIYNDYEYRTQADSLKKQIQQVGPTTEEGKLLQKKYDALVANIQSDLLKPPGGGPSLKLVAAS
jgi:hypothetical protein